MSLIVKSNCLVPTDNNLGYGVGLEGAYAAAFRFASGSGITTQTGDITITKKIPIIDDAGNTIYIPAGTFE